MISRIKVKNKMRSLGVNNEDICSHLRIDVNDFCLWLRGKKSLPYFKVWMILDFLMIKKDHLIDHL